MIHLIRMMLVAVLACLLGGFGPSAAAVPDPPAQAAVHVYDAPTHNAPGNGVSSDRGPPALADDHTAYDAVGHWPRGASARSSVSATYAHTTYDQRAEFAQVDSTTGTTSGPIRVASGDLLSFQRWRVAANKGSLWSRFRTLPRDERGAIRLPGGGPLSPNQMNRTIMRGNAPSGLTRVDRGKIPGEQTHIHMDDGSALNMDGTWKHGGTTLTNDQAAWLEANGWVIPR